MPVILSPAKNQRAVHAMTLPEDLYTVILSAAKNLRVWPETTLHGDSSLRSE